MVRIVNDKPLSNALETDGAAPEPPALEAAGDADKAGAVADLISRSLERAGSIFISQNRDTGGLTVASIDGDFEVLLDGRLLNVNPLPLREARLDRINRIIDSALAAETAHWRVGDAGGAAPGRNFSPEWTLENGNTLFAATSAGPEEAPVTLLYVCPVDGPGIRIAAGAITPSRPASACTVPARHSDCPSSPRTARC